MNIALNLSSAQLRNLRNGKGIRTSPAMFGSGVDIVIDPMNYNNLLKKLERGKGAVMWVELKERLFFPPSGN
jgi:hypothetical protein